MLKVTHKEIRYIDYCCFHRCPTMHCGVSCENTATYRDVLCIEEIQIDADTPIANKKGGKFKRAVFLNNGKMMIDLYMEVETDEKKETKVDIKPIVEKKSFRFFESVYKIVLLFSAILKIFKK